MGGREGDEAATGEQADMGQTEDARLAGRQAGRQGRKTSKEKSFHVEENVPFLTCRSFRMNDVEEQKKM